MKRNKLLTAYLTIFLFFVNSVVVDSLECFHCTNIDSVDNCTSISRCSYGQSCYLDFVSSGQTNVFNLGCIENQKCGVLPNNGPGIVGRDVNKRQSQTCHECCSTDNCNKHLCEHLKPTACVDSEKVDCAYMNTVANLCLDILHAKTICPRFCGLCSLVDGAWTDWSAWSSCDVTCENGTQSRHRTCTNPAPANGGLNCTGNEMETKVCQRELCPVHGGWTKWQDWETCSVSCDIGIQRHHRTCTNPVPDRFGDNCYGDTMDVKLCFPGPCANGGWSNWGVWDSCTVTCGGGTKTRSRTCTNPRPSPLGKNCEGDTNQVSACGNDVCLPNVAFNAYSVDDLSPAAGQTMVFTRVLVNEGGAYNNSTGEFTAPVHGTYSFSAQMCFANNQNLYFDIKVGDTTYASSYAFDASAVSCPMAQAVATVKKHQKVIVQWTHTTYTGNYIVRGDALRNYFTGIIVHA
ncbi:A disintegrin and metalloproteinase with thrombospondin motifs adt-1-like [Mercenaria mercenaria]|uniref:A disintegrin and metalloproteinase with thrombospondin motifs adt-1-like n=1 Tax=Mercenaria mercenaria TaxID=6596 RepID=UPI001E1DA83B|nr:A disintegrin and metalloproteinase with thrombospondin motifs adt-1-like [Mercenaria mercenaria]